jgi:hypothetical protein
MQNDLSLYRCHTIFNCQFPSHVVPPIAYTLCQARAHVRRVSIPRLLSHRSNFNSRLIDYCIIFYVPDRTKKHILLHTCMSIIYDLYLNVDGVVRKSNVQRGVVRVVQTDIPTPAFQLYIQIPRPFHPSSVGYRRRPRMRHRYAVLLSHLIMLISCISYI